MVKYGVKRWTVVSPKCVRCTEQRILDWYLDGNWSETVVLILLRERFTLHYRLDSWWHSCLIGRCRTLQTTIALVKSSLKALSITRWWKRIPTTNNIFSETMRILRIRKEARESVPSSLWQSPWSKVTSLIIEAYMNWPYANCTPCLLKGNDLSIYWNLVVIQ